jgi:HlyD family secretion protein
MRMSRPRFTILTLMIVVVIASLVLTAIAVYRQRIRLTALQSATADYKNARLTREVAEIAVKEYVEGIFVQDKAMAEDEIKLAQSDLSRSEERLDWATRMSKKGYVSKASAISEDLNLKKAQFALEQAESKLKVLLDYTRAKTIKELDSEVKTARANELLKKATLEQLKAAFARQWW